MKTAGVYELLGQPSYMINTKVLLINHNRLATWSLSSKHPMEFQQRKFCNY